MALELKVHMCVNIEKITKNKRASLVGWLHLNKPLTLQKTSEKYGVEGKRALSQNFNLFDF